MVSGASFAVYAPDGIGEVQAGDDLAALIGDALAEQLPPQDGDILVVTSKVVSKAEGRFVVAEDREAAIAAETVRVVATREHPGGGATRIVESRLGIVAAAAGVDASNTPEGTVLLLPEDPDASARRLREALERRFGVRLGVIVSDTLGRPWRVGQTDAAIGASGVKAMDDLRGSVDAQGRPLVVTQPAVADELAAAADLVKGKALGRPVALVRGLGRLLDQAAPGAKVLQRGAADDMFSLGTAEARQEGRRLGDAEGYARGYAEGLRAASRTPAGDAPAGDAPAGDAREADAPAGPPGG